MNSFNLNSQNKTADLKQENHILSIKESITSIENYSKELNTELEKKIKDKDELFKMYNQFHSVVLYFLSLRIKIFKSFF